MKTLTNFAIYGGCMDEYGGPEGLSRFCRGCGCGGLELIWGDAGYSGELPERGLVTGYHLCFWPDWLDLWTGNESALLRKFGSREAYTRFYGGSDREALLLKYRADIERARASGAQYAVFHVADVSVEEGYTRRWEHGDEQVIDAAAELLNELTGGRDMGFTLLLENQWWPGFTFTEPEKTARLLERVDYPDKGIMLDTGHLMNTDTSLRTQREGVEYIHRRLDEHGGLCRHILGVHLNMSLSGEYVLGRGFGLPEDMPDDYLARYGESYGHVLRVDEHRPWKDGAVAGVVARIAPRWLTHELAAPCRAAKEAALRRQIKTMEEGGAYLGTGGI